MQEPCAVTSWPTPLSCGPFVYGIDRDVNLPWHGLGLGACVRFDLRGDGRCMGLEARQCPLLHALLIIIIIIVFMTKTFSGC